MSQENPGREPDTEYNRQIAKVNGLLHELESTLNDDQHALLTRLFAERAVLAAMRVQADLKTETGDGNQQERGGM